MKNPLGRIHSHRHDAVQQMTGIHKGQRPMKQNLWFGTESHLARPSFLSGVARVLDLGGDL